MMSIKKMGLLHNHIVIKIGTSEDINDAVLGI